MDKGLLEIARRFEGLLDHEFSVSFLKDRVSFAAALVESALRADALAPRGCFPE